MLPPAQKNFGSSASSGTGGAIGGALEGRPWQSVIHHKTLASCGVAFTRP